MGGEKKLRFELKVKWKEGSFEFLFLGVHFSLSLFLPLSIQCNKREDIVMCVFLLFFLK